MPLVGSKPIKFRPRSLSDTLDEGNSKPGACASLQNLIPDPSTMACLQCRPAANDNYNFGDFANPGVISVALTVGNRVYGMVATSRNAGHDEPFVYDLVTESIVAISGTINSTTTPVSQPTAGAWTPPTMDIMGTMVVVTHPGFPGGVGTYFGWFDLTTFNVPVWHAGNVATNPLVAVPQAVRQFNNRLWFGVNNALAYTDALTNPPTATDATVTQVLIIGDTAPIQALCPLALETITQGILQSLTVFKNNYISQITGDESTSDLSNQDLSPQGVGTSAPRSVCTTPLGIFFVDDDGVRIVTQTGQITDPLEDVRIPFIFPVQRSRISGSYDNGVYRVCVQNGAVPGNPFQEFWYDFKYKMWTGPHTFRQDMATPYAGSFICFSNAFPAKLFKSDIVQGSTSGFVENGVLLQWQYRPSYLATSDDPNANSVLEATINIAYEGSIDITCGALDQNGNFLSACFLNLIGGVTIWGAFIWGAAIWFGIQTGLVPYRIPWTNTLCFTKLALQFSGASILGLKLSNIKIRYQPLGYIPQ